MVKVKDDPGRTRTCNPQIRSLVPYPLGHRACCFNVNMSNLYTKVQVWKKVI
jgi:hypothetical protein